MSGLRVLWMSNAPWCQTGYGVQANSLIPRLLDLESVEDVGIFAYYGLNGSKLKMPVGIEVPVGRRRHVWCYPPRSDIYGNDVLVDHARDFNADVMITLLDAWVASSDLGNKGYRWIPYMPVDMEPTPIKVLEKVWGCFRPLVYSRFGQQQLLNSGIAADYIPLGVETSIFRPLRGKNDQAECREVLGLPKDKFLVGCVGANKGYPARKGWPEMFEAFSIFNKRHPDTHLYCHTLATGEYQGFDLNEMCEDYGITPHVTFTHPYKHFIGIDQITMNAIYNALDVFFLPSMGEGFGVPIIEAQAAGCPVILTDWTAMTELMGAGWLVPVQKKVYSPLRSWQAYADVGACVDALEEAYKANMKPLKKAAREFSLQYDWGNITENFWKPYLGNLQAEITPRHYAP